jgi:hypothetical protein
VSGQLQAPVALPLEEEPPVPLDRRLGGPQSRSARREVKILDPTGLELRPLGRPASS